MDVVQFRPMERGVERVIGDIWERPGGRMTGKRTTHGTAIPEEQDIARLK